MLGLVLLSSAFFASGDLELPASAPTGPAVSLWCSLAEDNRYSVRLVSLIEGPFGGREVAVTAGHELEPSMACHLRTGQETRRAQLHAVGHPGVAHADWAIVVTDTRFVGNVDRFQMAVAGREEFTARMTVNSALAPACEVFAAPQHFDYPDTISLHSCRSLPGRSGAAMISQYEDRDYLIGINLGWVSDTSLAGEWAGYLRRVDADLIKKVNALRP